MELLLPVALKLFPNMLPSTFEDKYAAVSCVSLSPMLFSRLAFKGRKTTEIVTSTPRYGQVFARNTSRIWLKSQRTYCR